VDRYHCGKEEEALFPELERKEDFPPGCGPTAVLRAEHELARLHLRSMREALAGAGEGDARSVERFAEHAKAYHALLRAHIRKEEHCLFPDAEARLTSRDHEEINEAYKRVESRIGFETHERLIMAAHLLADRLGIPLIREAEDAGCGCRSEGGSTAKRETVPSGGGRDA
jgi:hemerythrin-like domain-containing protein